MAIKIVRKSYAALEHKIAKLGWQAAARHMLPTHEHCTQVVDMYPDGHENWAVKKMVNVAYLCTRNMPKYRSMLGHA